MFGNNKKTIGVFITQVNAEFQDILSKGIITKAKGLEYNVAFFTNFGGYGQLDYDNGETHITDLPNYEELDGIIIAPDTLIVKDMEEQYKTNIKNRAHCPVVSVRRETKDYYNVLIDDYSVLDEVISHFIEIHGFTRINFLAGPKDFPDSERRLSAYKRILKKHNIPIEEDRIYYGDFWKRKGIQAVDFWLNSPLERPQAIICANDFMALTVCNTLLERGISIPDQIAVSGCDDVEDSAEFSPSLTTARMPVFEMGMEAVEMIHKHNLGIEQPKNTYLKTITIYRESCGCKRNWYHEGNMRRRNHIVDRDTLQRAISRNADMSTELTGLTKLEEVVNKVWAYVYENENFTHFIMSLEKEWDYYQINGEEESTNNDNEIMMEVGYKNRVGFSKIKFPRKKLIPPELAEDHPMVYFFAMLHHQGHLFGYVGISFDKIQTYMLTFQAWVINVSNALENVRVHGELNRLVYQLEDMSIRDDLTGLYNRRVIDTIGKKYLKQCVEEQSKLMVFTADMDKLKYINDKFGHSRGDIALKIVAEALKKTADDDEICIRLGGDEFMAIGIDYDEAQVTEFINRFVEELNKFNFINEYDFGVYVSYGCNLILPDANTTIEGCLIAADTLMYQQKQEKEAKRLRTNLVC
ncbi:MAG: substrate-binding and GGDEF domain-containing protein [Mobilitalea sp.]